jgi:hypothetical protein
VARPRDQMPRLVALQGSELVLHSRKPKRIADGAGGGDGAVAAVQTYVSGG